MKKFENEIYMYIVLSKEENDEIVYIDERKEMDMEGVNEFLYEKDMKEKKFKKCYGLVNDEKVFEEGKVKNKGKIIGEVVDVEKRKDKNEEKIVEVK